MSDHKYEAERLIPNRGEALMPNHLALAQVHATLYLAEQQRVANLIAFMKQYGTGDDNASFIQYHGASFSEITKSIGLT